MSNRAEIETPLTAKAQDVQGLMSAIVDSSDDAIAGASLDHTILSWNAAATRLYDNPAGEMIGQSIARLIPADRIGELDQIFEVIQEGRSVHLLDTTRSGKDGLHTTLSVALSPIRNGEGEISGASLIAREITERKSGEALSDGQRQVMEMIVANAPLGDTLGALLGHIEA